VLLAGSLFLSLILLGVVFFVGLELWRSRAVARRALLELRAGYAKRVRKAISRALWRERMTQTPPAPATPREVLRSGPPGGHETLLRPRQDQIRPPPLPQDWSDDNDRTQPIPLDRRLTRRLRQSPDES